MNIVVDMENRPSIIDDASEYLTQVTRAKEIAQKANENPKYVCDETGRMVQEETCAFVIGNVHIYFNEETNTPSTYAVMSLDPTRKDSQEGDRTIIAIKAEEGQDIPRKGNIAVIKMASQRIIRTEIVK
jgi:hypothetical protein